MMIIYYLKRKWLHSDAVTKDVAKAIYNINKYATDAKDR